MRLNIESFIAEGVVTGEGERNDKGASLVLSSKAAAAKLGARIGWVMGLQS